ncbi:ABC transporter substrate-binding protein, partial [Chloroflexota bacterium]
CAPAVTPTTPTTPTVGKPRYGGWIGMSTDSGYSDRWDVFGPTMPNACFIYEGMLGGNWWLPEEESPATNYYFSPEQQTGVLAESWEVADPQTFIFHLRKGIHFQNKPPVNGREVVAEDVKWSIEQTLASPRAPKGILTVIDSMTCPEKYTIVIKTAEPRAAGWLYEAFLAAHSAGGYVAAHEVVDLYGQEGLSDWHNAIGTGAWMVDDFVAGSNAIFVRNPDYWAYDQNYPENKLPYADGVKFFTIKDVSSNIAALRTGKLDWSKDITWDQVESLLTTSPWLKHREFGPFGTSLLPMNYKREPFTDVRVRQAMCMAIDQDEIVNKVYGGHALKAIEHWPYMPSWGDMYVSPDEYPQVVRDMFSHNLVRAKELLAEAGYADGFSTEILCDTRSPSLDIVALVAHYLTDINVEATINSQERGVMSTHLYKHDYPQMALHTTKGMSTQKGPESTFQNNYIFASTYDYAGYDNPEFNEKFAQAKATLDADEQTKLWRELAIKVMVDAPYIIIPSYNNYIFWAPWIKGYWGQNGMHWLDYDMSKYWWIDLDLRKSIIGK